MLSTILREDRVQFGTATTWREAVERAAAPLLRDGSIQPSYVEKIIENISAPGGTYMDLGFGITLAHARPEAGVNATALSLFVLSEPVELADSPEHPVRLVFVLAATGDDEHQATMAELATLLVDAQAREALTAARSHADVLAAIGDER